MKKLYLGSPLLGILYIFFTLSLMSYASPVSDSIPLALTGTNSPELVHSFYASRDYRPAWTKNGKYSIKAYRFINLLNHAHYYGLNSDNYHVKEIMALKDAKPSDHNTGKMEALLTDSFFSFARHLKHGQLEQESLTLIKSKPENDALDIAFLEKALKSSSIKAELESLEPSHPYYHNLKTSLHEKLEVFNKNNNLWAGKKTEELRQDIMKLALNMERWRWEKQDFPANHIFVNVPSYTLELWENGEVTMESKVIVGTARQKTSIQDYKIGKYIIHPTCVSKEVFADEILPSILKDPTYLFRNAYEVIDGDDLVDTSTIDWTAFSDDDFPYVLRQPDPIHKSLDYIKFELDSSGVLHDSKSNILFFRNVRALSGGCIIMEKAQDLALYLVKEEPETTPSLIEEYITTPEYREIEVNQPLKVFVRYFTADGSEIYQDIYNEDGRLMAYFNDMVKENKSNLNLQRIR